MTTRRTFFKAVAGIAAALVGLWPRREVPPHTIGVDMASNPDSSAGRYVGSTFMNEDGLWQYDGTAWVKISGNPCFVGERKTVSFEEALRDTRLDPDVLRKPWAEIGRDMERYSGGATPLT